MKHSKYHIEIDTGGPEASGYEDRLPWVSYGTIVSEGDTLDELLENASVDLIDQDGGERGQVEAEENWMQELIAEKFYGQDMLPNETLGDFRARMERAPTFKRLRAEAGYDSDRPTEQLLKEYDQALASGRIDATLNFISLLSPSEQARLVAALKAREKLNE